MKKITVLFLLCSIIFSGCSLKTETTDSNSDSIQTITSDSSDSEAVSDTQSSDSAQSNSASADNESSVANTSSFEQTEEWKETVFEVEMYVIEPCYSRVKAIVGSDSVDYYEFGQKVKVVAKTDTEYYKISDGSFIHFDFLSDKLEGSENSSAEETKENTYSSPNISDDGVQVINGITYVNGILIANKTYSLPSDYAPGIDDEAYNALSEMEAAAASEGISIWLNSGYRSYYDQEAIYNNYCYRDGREEADTYSARPGHSEHQTGLAFDLNSFEESFGETPEGIWLANNCYKYGFIIRYPKGKESVTGYIYEPWHVRYLGKEAATKVYNSGVSLEEYLGITSKYSN